MNVPKRDIKNGNAYLFDASNDWWVNGGKRSPKPTDWAHSAARGIIANLQGRQGIKHELSTEKVDEETRVEIVAEIAAIIRAATPKR